MVVVVVVVVMVVIGDAGSEKGHQSARAVEPHVMSPAMFSGVERACRFT